MVSSEERIERARHISWIFTGIAYFFLAINFLFILTMLQMGHRLTVLVQLFTFSQTSKNLVISDALDQDVASLDLLNEAMIRLYVINRHATLPDYTEMQRRFLYGGPIQLLSSPYVYYQLSKDGNLETYLSSAAQSAPRDVVINKVNKIGNNWQVEFDVVANVPGNTQRRTYIASMRVENYPSRAVWLPWFNNPVGTTIVEYNFYPKENS